jgi:hypothetical protein
MAFELASLFVSIKGDDSPLQRQFGAIRAQLGAVGVAIGTAAGNLLSGTISAASSSLFGFVSRGISGATDLAETISKVNTVFGGSAATLIGQADRMASAFGLPKQAILDAAASIGLVGKAAGQSQSESAAMATTMAKLAADASSFYNVPLDVALEKIRSGLVGESEPLRAFGVLLSEEAVANEAMALGLARSKKELDDQAKVAARASLIQKGLADASGDLERTADSTANQWRKFTGTLENTAVAIGTALAPAINAVIGSLGAMVADVAGYVEANAATFAAWGESIGSAIRSIPQYWDEFQAGVQVAYLRLEEFGTNTLAWIGVLPENFANFGEWFANNWTGLVRDGANAALAIFQNLGTNLRDLWTAVMDFFSTGRFEFKPTGLLEGFKATVGELPEIARPALVSMDDAVNAVGADLARRTEERNRAAAQQSAQTGLAARQATQAAAQASEKQKEFKSQTFDSDDFYTKLREQALSGKDDTAAKQLAEQKRTADAAEKTAALLGGGALVARLA